MLQIKEIQGLIFCPSKYVSMIGSNLEKTLNKTIQPALTYPTHIFPLK